MGLSHFTASATTCGVEPGEELVGKDGLVHIQGRVFTDLVDSLEPRISGTNRLTVSLDLNPETGKGSLTASFVLTPKLGKGSWTGAMSGSLNGMITAEGLARGTGDLEGMTAYLSFQQVAEHPAGQPACDDALAYYRMAGILLEPT